MEQEGFGPVVHRMCQRELRKALAIHSFPEECVAGPAGFGFGVAGSEICQGLVNKEPQIEPFRQILNKLGVAVRFGAAPAVVDVNQGGRETQFCQNMRKTHGVGSTGDSDQDGVRARQHPPLFDCRRDPGDQGSIFHDWFNRL